MSLKLILNDDPSRAVIYKIARVIYAETGGESLRDVEALASMIGNIHTVTGRTYENIVSDPDLFESLNNDSERHSYLDVDAGTRAFDMCVRVTQTMMRGHLPDSAMGAMRFHRTDQLPSWAVSRGYILETSQLTFYL